MRLEKYTSSNDKAKVIKFDAAEKIPYLMREVKSGEVSWYQIVTLDFDACNLQDLQANWDILCKQIAEGSGEVKLSDLFAILVKWKDIRLSVILTRHNLYVLGLGIQVAPLETKQYTGGDIPALTGHELQKCMVYNIDAVRYPDKLDRKLIQYDSAANIMYSLKQELSNAIKSLHENQGTEKERSIYNCMLSVKGKYFPAFTALVMLVSEAAREEITRLFITLWIAQEKNVTTGESVQGLGEYLRAEYDICLDAFNSIVPDVLGELMSPWHLLQQWETYKNHVFLIWDKVVQERQREQRNRKIPISIDDIYLYVVEHPGKRKIPPVLPTSFDKVCYILEIYANYKQ